MAKISVCFIRWLGTMALLGACAGAPKPGASVTIEGPTLVYLDHTATYEISVNNPSPKPRQSAEIVVSVPEKLAYVVSTPEGRVASLANSPASVTFSIGEIAPKSTVKIVMDFKGSQIGGDEIRVTLTSPLDDLEARVLVKVLGVPAMNVLARDTQDPVQIGKNTTYRITLSNKSSAPCTNIALRCRVPQELAFVSAQGETPFARESNTLTFEPYPILMPAGEIVYQVECQAMQEGLAVFTAELGFDEGEGPVVYKEKTDCRR